MKYNRVILMFLSDHRVKYESFSIILNNAVPESAQQYKCNFMFVKKIMV